MHHVDSDDWRQLRLAVSDRDGRGGWADVLTLDTFSATRGGRTQAAAPVVAARGTSCAR